MRSHNILQVRKLEEQVAEIEKQNPNIYKNPENLSKLVLSGSMNELQVAYFTEIKNTRKNRGITDIQKIQDEVVISLNESMEVHEVEIVDMSPNEKSSYAKQSKTLTQKVDAYARTELAEMIGLSTSPKLKPNAMNKLDGFFGKRLPSKDKLDSVELVKSVREDWMDYH